MGLDTLLAALEREARLREERILDGARAQAAAILADAHARAGELDQRAAMVAGERETRSRERAAALARIATRHEALRIQDAMSEALLAALNEKFQRFMETPAYAPFAARLFELARRELGGEAAAKADPATARALSASLGISVEADPAIENGFVMTGAASRRFIRFSFALAISKFLRLADPSPLAPISRSVGHGL